MNPLIFIIAHWVTLSTCVKRQGFIVFKNIQFPLQNKQKYSNNLNSFGILKNYRSNHGFSQESECGQERQTTTLAQEEYKQRKDDFRCCKRPRNDENFGKEPFKRVEEGVETIKIISPPPNLTGDLHIGNLMNLVCTDAFRIHSELNNKKVNVNFSNDHAGQSFQKIFDRKYHKSEETGRWDQSEEMREEKRKLSLEECSRIKKRHLDDLGTLGIEWPYGNFTLDPEVENYTKRVFIELYEKKLISQEDWPTLCNYYKDKVEPISASDVDYKLIKKTLYTLKLSTTKIQKDEKTNKQFEGDQNNELDLSSERKSEDGIEILISTTMPEFYYGTTGIGVSREDYERVKDRVVYLPKVDKLVPIVPMEKISEDNSFDQSSDSKCIKGELIIPGHLESDFWVAKKNDLKVVNILNTNGKLQNVPFRLLGCDLDEAKKDVMELFEEQGTVDVKVPVNMFDESTRVITVPIMQYILDTKKLSEKALEALEEIKVVPENRRSMIENRLKDIRNWCLSRHGWWGVRVPIYYLYNDSKYYKILATSKEEAEKSAESLLNVNIQEKYNQGYKLKQEERILDTWFTSSLWPLIVNQEGKEHSARNILFTCYDILESWIVKMLLMCSNIDKSCLFKEVYLHGMVSDEKGKKMSKSQNNTVDLKELMGLFEDLNLNQFEKEDFDTLKYSQEQSNGPSESLEQLIKSNLVRLKLLGICKCTDFTKSYREKDRSLYILTKYYQILNFYKTMTTKGLSNDSNADNEGIGEDKNKMGVAPDQEYLEKLISSKLDEIVLLMSKNMSRFQFSNCVYNLEEYLKTFSDYLVPYIRFTMNTKNVDPNHFNRYFRDLSSVMMPFTPTFVNSLLLNRQFIGKLKWPLQLTDSDDFRHCSKNDLESHFCCRSNNHESNNSEGSMDSELMAREIEGYSEDFKEFESILSEIRRKASKGYDGISVGMSKKLYENIDKSFISYLIKLTSNKAPNIKYNII